MTDSNDPQAPHPDALDALHNMSTGKSPGAMSREESVDASGFVGMLARGNQNEGEPTGPVTGKPTMRPMPKVSPKAVASAPPVVNQLSAAIPVAKEIVQEAPAEAVEDAPAEEHVEVAAEAEGAAGDDTAVSADAAEHEEVAATSEEGSEEEAAVPVQQATTVGYRGRQRRRVPGWFHAAVPVSFTVGALLTLIGLWSLMAVLSKATGTAMAPGFSPEESVIMPMILLLSLPVGIALEIMGVMMRKQLKIQEQWDAGN